MTKAILSSLLTVWLLLVGSQTVYAWETVHQSPENFLAEFLPGCEKKALWFDLQVIARLQLPFDKMLSDNFLGKCLQVSSSL